jgi:hypothetical protein
LSPETVDPILLAVASDVSILYNVDELMPYRTPVFGCMAMSKKVREYPIKRELQLPGFNRYKPASDPATYISPCAITGLIKPKACRIIIKGTSRKFMLAR